MKVILHNSGNHGSDRFLASADEQDVPAAFGRAMVGRGMATEVKKQRQPAAAADDEQGEG